MAGKVLGLHSCGVVLYVCMKYNRNILGSVLISLDLKNIAIE
jgi:hypothetical protein